ncbi:MAG TPA: methyltransferase domain-containing protein [Burkholderiales bacterium]|nr:methyltransferase domain-containing protein [Burkholderiales bacterium]
MKKQAHFILACVFALACTPTHAAEDYKPVMGQKGKDVVWIPSPTGMVDLMLDMAKVTPQDFVIDLGSGDGRNVIAAAKRGAKALGVEYNPDLVELSKRNAAAAGVGDKAMFAQGDMFAADLSQASALILFLIPQNLEKLAPKFVAMKPGTRIVSNTYEIGGGWEPDDTQRLPLCASWCGAHLYIVPARVAGTWRLPEGDLILDQAFQYVWGSYDYDGITVYVENGRLKGDEIDFFVNGVEYTGRISGDTMSGTAKGRATTTSWSAKRVSP